MNISKLDNDQSYKRILERLTPRHAPTTNMTFAPPRNKRSFRLAVQWSSRVASVILIVGMLAFFLIQPQTTVSAVQVIESGIDNIRTSGYCQIDLSARILPTRKGSPLRISPRGDLVPVSVTYRTNSNYTMLDMRWMEGDSLRTLRMFPFGEVDFEGGLVSNTRMSEMLSVMSNILLSPSPDYEKMLDPHSLEMKTKGDIITIRNIDDNKKMELNMTFSKSSGRLLGFSVFDSSYGEKRLMLKTNKINYLKTYKKK